MLAIGSSFMTYASKNNNKAIVTGYIILPSSICASVTTCDTTASPGRICTVTYQGQIYQVFRKSSPTDTFCPILCYCPIR